jgi:hypothetical protein
VGSRMEKEFGVAFIVHKVTKRNIMAFTSINKRICTLRIKTKFFTLSIITVHVPTERRIIQSIGKNL